MDTQEAAFEDEAIDFTEVNNSLAFRAIKLAPTIAKVLAPSTGTAQIPLLKGRGNREEARWEKQ